MEKQQPAKKPKPAQKPGKARRRKPPFSALVFRVLGVLRPRTRKSAYALFVGTCLFLVLYFILLLDNQTVRVYTQEVPVVGLHRDLEGFTILHISDLHGRSFGENQSSLARALSPLRYDMVAITGDMVGKSQKTQPFYDLLSLFPASRRVYFIPGDSDPPAEIDTPRYEETTLGRRVLAEYILKAQELGAVYLDAPRSFTVGATTVWVSPEYQSGIQIPETQQAVNAQVDMVRVRATAGDETAKAQLPGLVYRQAQLMAMAQAASAMREEQMHIALAHIPPDPQSIHAINPSADTRDLFLAGVDVTLAGHYCAGVWQIPPFGALYVPDITLPRFGWFPDKSVVEGLRTLGGIHLYTSPGLGATDRIWLPKIRLFNPPSVTLIKLVSG